MFQCQHSQDQLALSYLEDVWVERDPVESRCFTIEFVCIFVLGSFCGIRYFILKDSSSGGCIAFQGKPILLGRGAEEGV
jgi:hypothetical protein